MRMRHTQGLKLIPQKKRPKEPIMKYLQYIENADLQQTWEEIYDNFLSSSSLQNNIAVLLGRSSNGAVCIDFDNKEVFQDFWGKMLDELLSRTLVEESHHGFHCFFLIQMLSSRNWICENASLVPDHSPSRSKPIVCL